VLEVFTFIVAAILLLLPVIDWGVSYILFRASKKLNHSNLALKERGQMAGVLATASTLNAILAFIRLGELHIEPVYPILILSISLILGSVPNIYWLFLYTSNRLRK
jgi:hypothetical protein